MPENEEQLNDSTHADDSAVRERLHTLLAEHSQSEIARKTGALVASVNRYVHGARIPASFCAALVRGLGINPSWLLVGEGSPNLADVPENTSKLGENLLALVEAMSAVARMRLGSLTGKHHLKVLRELNDALSAHERLREKLNEQSRPLFAQMIKDLNTALDKRDLQRAGELRKAVEQLHRLCDDEKLERDFYRVQAYHEFQLKNSAKLLQLQRKLFLRSLPDGTLFDEAACEEARRLVVALVQMNRMEEALRVCRATRQLAGGKGRDWDSFTRLENTHGIILADLGLLREGIAHLQRSLPKLEGMHRKISEAGMVKFMMWAGLLSLQDAMHVGEHTDAKADHFLQFACWTEDSDGLEAAISYSKAPDVQPIWRGTFHNHYAEALQIQLEKPSAKAVNEFRPFMESNMQGPNADEMDFMRLAAAVSHVQYVSGNKQAAEEELWRAENHRRAIKKEVLPETMTLATHYRNAQRLFEKPSNDQQRQLLKRGAKFFARYFRGGYACFEKQAAKAQELVGAMRG